MLQLIQSLTSILDKGLFQWIGKNKTTFLLVTLFGLNVYQYTEKGNTEQKYFDESKRLNQVIQENEQKATEYERNRSEKLEYLLNNLSKYGK